MPAALSPSVWRIRPPTALKRRRKRSQIRAIVSTLPGSKKSFFHAVRRARKSAVRIVSRARTPASPIPTTCACSVRRREIFAV